MGLEGGKRKKVETAAKTALRMAILAATLTSNDPSMAGGKRESSRIVEGVQLSETLKKQTVAEDSPKETDEK